jgi:hypothetical protein
VELTLEKRWGFFLMMADVVVSRRIVDVQAITADSGRNVDVRWRREMTDR